MMDATTGHLTELALGDPRIDNPPAGTVILHGTKEDVQKVATDVQRRYQADKAKAKRKAQRAARKRNR